MESKTLLLHPSDGDSDVASHTSVTVGPSHRDKSDDKMTKSNRPGEMNINSVYHHEYAQVCEL